MRVALGLGANVGNAQETVLEAARQLAADGSLRGALLSPLYRTAPVGGVEQPDFINAVLVADTDCGPEELIVLARTCEQAHGRTRSIRWGPRTLDVDVLALDEVVADSADITLPHPRAHERAFVLVPWAAVEPDAVIAGHGTVAECLARIPRADLEGVQRLASAEVQP